MKLLEAMKSGRRFRREGSEDTWRECRYGVAYYNECNNPIHLTINILEADYELEPIEIKAGQIWKTDGSNPAFVMVHEDGTRVIWLRSAYVAAGMVDIRLLIKEGATLVANSFEELMGRLEDG